MDSNKEKKNFMYVSLCLPCKLIRPRLLYPRKKFLCFGIRQESASGTTGGDTLKANECFLSDVPPGKECADRMGDSPPGKEGQSGSAMPKAGNPAKRELDQPAEAAGKEAGNRERKKK